MAEPAARTPWTPPNPKAVWTGVTAGLVWLACAIPLNEEQIVLSEKHEDVYRFCAPGPEANMLHCFASQVFTNMLKSVAFLNLVAYLLFLGSCAVNWLVFGPLRAVETSRHADRAFRLAMTKLVFIPIVAIPSFAEVAVWLVWYAFVGVLRLQVQLARHRIKNLGSALRSDWTAYYRIFGLLGAVVVINGVAALFTILGLMDDIGVSAAVVLLYDCLVVFLECVKTAILCGAQVHERLADLPDTRVTDPTPESADTSKDAGSSGGSGGEGSRHSGVGSQWRSWDLLSLSRARVSACKFYVNIGIETVRNTATMLHLANCWCVYGADDAIIGRNHAGGWSISCSDVTLFLLFRIAATSLRRNARSFIAYRQAARALDHVYPTIPGSELVHARIQIVGKYQSCMVSK